MQRTHNKRPSALGPAAKRLPAAPGAVARPPQPKRRAPPARPKGTAGDGDGAVRSWLSVVRAYHLCEAVITRRLAALDVRLPEHEILANLRRDPGITQQVLAARCFSAKSHISALLSTLEGRGWVRRAADPDDARAKRLFLQPEGQRVAALTAAVQAEVVAAMADAVTPLAMQQVSDSMARVGERLRTMLDPD